MDIETLLKKIDIYEEIRSIEASIDPSRIIKKSGPSYKMCCPFHNENTPSLYITPQKGIYKCFGCGEGGNIIKYITKRKNITNGEAIDYLQKKYNPEYGNIQEKDNNKKNYKEIIEKIKMFNEEAIKFFQHNLFETEDGERAIEYLLDRGFDKDFIKEQRIGYAVMKSRSLCTHLCNKYPNDKNIISTSGLGVLKEGKYNNKYWIDTFQGRIMIPLIDTKSIFLEGDLKKKDYCIGFGGRDLFGFDDRKYLNTKETMLYKKSNYLYGMHDCLDIIKKTSKVFLVEGYMDALSMKQSNIKNVIASMGTSFTAEQAIILKNLGVKEVVVIFDNDGAGEIATEKAIYTLNNIGITPYVWDLSVFKKFGIKDIDNFINYEKMKKYSNVEKGELVLTQIEKQKKDGFSYLYDKFIENKDLSKMEIKKEILLRFVPFFKSLDMFDKENYSYKLSLLLNMREDNIYEYFTKENPDNEVYKIKSISIFESMVLNFITDSKENCFAVKDLGFLSLEISPILSEAYKIIVNTKENLSPEELKYKVFQDFPNKKISQDIFKKALCDKTIYSIEDIKKAYLTLDMYNKSIDDCSEENVRMAETDSKLINEARSEIS